MDSNSTINQGFNSLFSLQRLVLVLKKMISEGKPGAKKLYQGLLNEIESKPHLLQPMTELTPLKQDAELVDTFLSTIFPPSTSSNEGLYAVSFPFRLETIYSSPRFREIFLNGSDTINIQDKQTNSDIGHATLCLAYNVILKRLYSLAVPLTATSIHAFKDQKTSLTRYYELKLNAQFVDVK